MSKMWMPSKPWPTSWPPQDCVAAPAALVGSPRSGRGCSCRRRGRRALRRDDRADNGRGPGAGGGRRRARCQREARPVADGLRHRAPRRRPRVRRWQTWTSALRWSDVIVFFICYLATALGVTVGFHRLFTHRAFKTKPWVRGMFAIFGSAAIEGPSSPGSPTTASTTRSPTSEGDPHSPHVDHGHGLGGRAARAPPCARRLAVHPHPARRRKRYAPDLLADPVIAWVDRTFVVWASAACCCRSSSAG